MPWSVPRVSARSDGLPRARAAIGSRRVGGFPGEAAGFSPLATSATFTSLTGLFFAMVYAVPV